MSERKAMRKNVMIFGDIFNHPTWSTAFPQVPFTPDEVRLKAVSNTNTSGGPLIISIWSNLINDTLCTVASTSNTGQSQAFDIIFPLGFPVQSSYIFQARAYDGSVIPAGGTAASVMIQLEFVKYS